MAKGPAEVAHGPMLVGFVLNILLYGIMITQVYLYFTTFKRDKAWMKILVSVLFVADTMNAIFDFIYIYNSVIVHFDDVPFLMNADWVFATDPGLTGIIACIMQVFFAWRIKVLTNNTWLACVVVSFAIAGGVGGIITAVEVERITAFVDFRKFKSVVILWLAAECICDALIASILVWHLVSSYPSGRKRKTGFQISDELVDRIIRLTMQTGFLTALCATLDLCFFLSDPTGTMMSSLNSRGGWKEPVGSSGARDPESGSCPIVLRYSEPPKNPNNEVIKYQERPGVHIHVESHELRDMEDSKTSPVDSESWESGNTQTEKPEGSVTC
ncbi:hypothetical protein C8J56DRAFT_1038418 [Mycena floridula]|nr:hypothetical protein C8J56DRAFT_1038418 [Mycena floridula]